MFNYIKETIINDAANLITGSSTEFGIKRAGNYKAANVLDTKYYCTKGVQGSVGTLVIDKSKLTGGDYYQIALFIGASEKVSDFALANWHEFGKPVLIETDATDLKSTLELALPNDNPLYTVSVSGNNVTLTLAESWMSFEEAKFYKVQNDVLTELTGVGTITANVPDFATGKWLVENLRFPTYANRRYTALYSDETPIKGALYNQYAFEYEVERSTPGGLSAVGQKVTSITTHVFYVLKGDVSNAFEGMLDNCELTKVDSDQSGS